MEMKEKKKTEEEAEKEERIKVDLTFQITHQAVTIARRSNLG